MSSISSAFLVDQYQLSMMEGYLKHGMNQTAVFELFVRRLPKQRNFLIAAGLEQALSFLESLRFSEEEVNWLAEKGTYSVEFLNYLRTFKFTGDVDAMPEGTIFFPNEPILQIKAPLAQAQFIETRLINLLHYQTLVASKAVRSVLTAPGKTLIDFGLRRSHGYEAGLMAARASYLAGFTGTSTVLADQVFQIPSFGTMAHSYIEAHSDESTAFLNFAEAHPENTIFLLDTYNTLEAAKKVCRIAPELKKRGISVNGIRLDSGNLAEYSLKVRQILDQADLDETEIFVSGNLDEDKISALLKAGAPIDGFGVGTHLTTSTDAPYLDMVYKLQEYDGVPKRKKSEGKTTWPGIKQVYREVDKNGVFLKDVVTLRSEAKPGSLNPSLCFKPLLNPVMMSGKRVSASTPIKTLRESLLNSLSQIPDSYKGLDQAASPYPVEISNGLYDLAKQVDETVGKRF